MDFVLLAQSVLCDGISFFHHSENFKLIFLQVTTACFRLTAPPPQTTPQETSAPWVTTAPLGSPCISLAPWDTTWMWPDKMNCQTVKTALAECTVQEVEKRFLPATAVQDITVLKVKVQPHLHPTSRWSGIIFKMSFLCYQFFGVFYICFVCVHVCLACVKIYEICHVDCSSVEERAVLPF